MKPSMKSLKAKLATAVKGKTVKAFVVDQKHVKALAHNVIEKAKHAHEGVRSIIVTWKGERPETLEALKEQIRAECKAWLKSEGKAVNPQSIYNYQSDLVACASGYAAYAGMTDAGRSAFDKAHSSITGYHALVKFLRDTKRGRKLKADAPSKGKRIKSLWKNHQRKTLGAAKDMLRYAPTVSLLVLQDFVASLISARKKGGEEGANIRKLLRKAA